MIGEHTTLAKHIFLLASLVLGINIIFSFAVFCRPFTLSSDSTTAPLQTKREPRILNAVRIQNGGIHLDGVLDENEWERAPSGTGFIQNEPNDGMPASEKTTVKIFTPVL